MQQIESLLDHLVGEGKERRWHIDAKTFGGLEVDHELEFDGLHDRQVGGLFTLENPSSVKADLVKGIVHIGAVAHQATGNSRVSA